jgi:citrate synthase
MIDVFLTTAAAAARLGVSRNTLYAYVSRGRLRALRKPGQRGSFFDPVDLDALARRARAPAERRPDLNVRSAVTLIERGRYWYRGHDPAGLAASCRFEGVAELLWTERDPALPATWTPDGAAAVRARAAQAALPRDTPPIDRLRVILAVLGAADPLRVDLRPEGAVSTARRLLATAALSLPGRQKGSIADALMSWLGPRRRRAATIAAVDAALIVMADHELAASTLAVRVAAAFKADPYAAVSAGLGAVSGAWHGAASLGVERMIAQVARGRRPAAVLGLALARDGHVPGFGQPLYPDGDPRLPVLRDIARRVGSTAHGDALLRVAADQQLPPPNVDFGLALVARALGLVEGGGEAIFVVGRLAGWLAHAIEEYKSPSALRMRALYVGPPPPAEADRPRATSRQAPAPTRA